MNHLFLMAWAIFGGIGWWMAMRRESVWVIFRWAAWPAIVWLAIYCLTELLRSEPVLWSDRAQMSLPTLFIIAIGIFLLMQTPRSADGGESHA